MFGGESSSREIAAGSSRFLRCALNPGACGRTDATACRAIATTTSPCDDFLSRIPGIMMHSPLARQPSLVAPAVKAPVQAGAFFLCALDLQDSRLAALIESNLVWVGE